MTSRNKRTSINDRLQSISLQIIKACCKASRAIVVGSTAETPNTLIHNENLKLSIDEEDADITDRINGAYVLTPRYLLNTPTNMKDSKLSQCLLIIKNNNMHPGYVRLADVRSPNKMILGSDYNVIGKGKYDGHATGPAYRENQWIRIKEQHPDVRTINCVEHVNFFTVWYIP